MNCLLIVTAIVAGYLWQANGLAIF